MTDLPPPSNPPPGWYPDPQQGGEGSLRWWDGSGWTQDTQDGSAAGSRARSKGPTSSGMAPVGEWMSEMIQLAAGRAGHFFTMIVVLLVPISLVNGLSLWSSFNEAVLHFDAESGAVSLDNPGGSVAGFAVFGASLVVLLLASLLLAVAAVHQAQAVLGDRVELWSDSMHSALGRFGRVLGVTLVVVAILLVAYLVTMAISLAVPPLALLVVPMWIAGSLWLYVRLNLAGVTASLAPSGVRSLATTWGLTRRRFWAVLGRIALLVLVAVTLSLVVSLVATPFTAIAGGTSDAAISPGDEEILLSDVIGSNPAIFAISQLFGAIGNGASTIIWAIGMTLIYRDLSGPVERADDEDDDIGEDAGGLDIE